mmetsp:Transcript_23808/g.66496  ORF Transcript_23808/g.66496 Transcript_23808/m.66496 type:complete len:101 (-) Transcript_23808:183-485(-)
MAVHGAACCSIVHHVALCYVVAMVLDVVAVVVGAWERRNCTAQATPGIIHSVTVVNIAIVGTSATANSMVNRAGRQASPRAPRTSNKDRPMMAGSTRSLG